MAQHLAQVPDSVIGFVDQNERIGIRGHTCGSRAIVVKFIHVGMIAACEAPALGACLTNGRRHEGCDACVARVAMEGHSGLARSRDCEAQCPRRADFCDRYATHSGYYVSETIAEICRREAAAVGASLVRQAPGACIASTFPRRSECNGDFIRIARAVAPTC